MFSWPPSSLWLYIISLVLYFSGQGWRALYRVVTKLTFHFPALPHPRFERTFVSASRWRLYMRPWFVLPASDHIFWLPLVQAQQPAKPLSFLLCWPFTLPIFIACVIYPLSGHKTFTFYLLPQSSASFNLSVNYF